ncbi:MAG: hypothetical protein V1808_04940 [Candidatus Daviesbacteria bacterium]
MGNLEKQLPSEAAEINVQLAPSSNKKRILIAISMVTIFTIVILAGMILYKKYQQKSVSYKLNCGNTECSFSQIKPGAEISLRIDASSAFAKYKDANPNLCYYSNIEPTQNLLKWEAVTIEGKKFMGGCIKNAYNFYQKQSQFAFYIKGKAPKERLTVKALLISSWEGTAGANIKKEGVEIFNLK